MARGMFFCIVFLILNSISSGAQIVTTTPAFPVADQPVTITVDVTGTSLANFAAYDATTNPVYIWSWIRKPGTADVDAPTNINPATAAADPAKCTRVSVNVYQIIVTPTTFFNKPLADIPQIGFKLKTKNWADNKQTDVDKFITFTSGFAVQLSQPSTGSFFVNTGNQIPIVASTSQNSNLTLKVNGIPVATATNATTISYNHTVTETTGSVPVVFEATNGTETKTISFTYTLRSATINAPIPAGIKNGINYYPADKTKATLRLWAPGKSSVYVLGDFNDWSILSSYQMKKSGEYFWLDLTGLTEGTEYAFHYLVDETIRIADPFADKILDPEDSFIPAATYPNLKTFPAKALSDKWYFNRASVLQTGQTPYVWKTTNFQKPLKDKLVVYELLVRDFFGEGKKNYQNLIDTINYFKRLGINAIELMPVTEFSGNDSWGYNPTFMFAPDKFYGTKDKLKEFIDKCHQNGIAVIFDIVMNQQDAPNSFLLLDFDFTAFRPTANNKWFNVEATHPFNVFFDMNHESTYTKAYLDTINHYWINEYKVDGYRYDLSKGFTQTKNTDVGAWSNYDASRIAILKRMYDKIRTYSTDSYIILEHFADNREEIELSSNGMMLWANFNHAYTQNSIGYLSGSDIYNMFYKNRGLASANAVGYMESHDEERMMYKNLKEGNLAPGYSVKNLATALNRIKAAATLFYTIPGPKMIWQFGELGYDVSIEQGGRTSAKPILWNYYSEPDRKKLYDYTAELMKAKTTYPIFNTTDATITQGTGSVKEVKLKGVPYIANPTSTNEMNLHAFANFDVNPTTVPITFLHTGKWYDYITGLEYTIATNPYSMTLQPGDYYLFTDVAIKPPVTGIEEPISDAVVCYPNPTSSIVKVDAHGSVIQQAKWINAQGKSVNVLPIDGLTWDISNLPAGLYILELKTNNTYSRKKVIKQ
jgi:1,4-alpha-glucan branching enzyme